MKNYPVGEFNYFSDAKNALREKSDAFLHFFDIYFQKHESINLNKVTEDSLNILVFNALQLRLWLELFLWNISALNANDNYKKNNLNKVVLSIKDKIFFLYNFEDLNGYVERWWGFERMKETLNENEIVLFLEYLKGAEFKKYLSNFD